MSVIFLKKKRDSEPNSDSAKKFISKLAKGFNADGRFKIPENSKFLGKVENYLPTIELVKMIYTDSKLSWLKKFYPVKPRFLV